MPILSPLARWCAVVFEPDLEHLCSWEVSLSLEEQRGPFGHPALLRLQDSGDGFVTWGGLDALSLSFHISQVLYCLGV